MSSESTNQQYFGSYWNEYMITYLNQSAGGRWVEYLLGLILREIPPNEVRTVADVGCGVGKKTVQMANYFVGAEVTGYDFSEAGINAARHHYSLANVHFETEDITTADYPNRYDLITAFDLLEHIEDWQGLAAKLININNRYVILSSPVGRMRPYEVNIGHFRNFRRNELEEFMESRGYRTVKVLYAGFPFYSPILRDLTNRFFKNYSEIPESEMGFLSRRMHDVWYFLFRYCSLKSHGDNFVGLFKRRDKD